jgi:hypothetical protein
VRDANYVFRRRVHVYITYHDCVLRESPFVTSFAQYSTISLHAFVAVVNQIQHTSFDVKAALFTS